MKFGEDNLSEEGIILRSHHQFENDLSLPLLAAVKGLKLMSCRVLDATLIAAPSSTVIGTAANVDDMAQARALVHGEEADVVADAGGLCGFFGPIVSGKMTPYLRGD